MMSTPKKKIAHFLLLSYLHNSPPNDAMHRAYSELGCDVDFYAPDNEDFNSEHNADIKNVAYGFSWLVKNLFSKRWKRYDAISCTCEDPVAIAGSIAFIWRKPLIVLADEIKSGAYYGDRPERFKKLCRWAARRAKLTIVNDSARIELQRDYVGLKEDAEIMVYPGCFLNPPQQIDPKIVRSEWGVSDREFVLSHSGSFGVNRGIEWIFDSLAAVPDMRLLLQPLGIDSLTKYFITRHKYSDQMIIAEKRLTWQQAWQSCSGVDCGLAIYLDNGPQFQLMGISSNRLCMFLAMGIPVIATWQPSFEFIEEYECGVLIKEGSELEAAIEKVRSNLEVMKHNALRCSAEYIDTKNKYQTLKSNIAKVLGVSGEH